MASLNTLRTKGGVIVSIVIGIALLSFLLTDLLSPGKGLFGQRKMHVGEIAGTTIDYTEYHQESEYMTRIAQLMTGTESLNNEQTEQAREMAWESLVVKHSYTPGFEALGIVAGESEQVDMTSGVYISPVIEGTFVNRSTGVFDIGELNQFISRRDTDPNAAMMWDYMKEQMVNQRVMSKFLALVTQGMTVNDLDVEQSVQAANSTYAARYISQPYTSVADSLVKVTDSEIRSYYDKHKNSFRQGESRTIEYVVFDMLPSQADYDAAGKQVADIAQEFEQAEDPMQYAQINSAQRPDPRFVNPATLSPELAALANNKNAMAGPTMSGDVYSMSRLAATRMLPDTLGASHILIAANDTKLADSLVGALRKGADFAALATQYSLDQAPGGDLGRFTPDQMIPEFSDACVKANKGDIFTVTSQYGLHVVKLTYKTAPVLKVQIATVTYNVIPSGETEQDIYSRASAFAAAAAGSVEKFNATVAAEGLSKRTARIRNTERNINGVENSREIVRWAFTSEKGTISVNTQVGGGDYIIAALTEVRHQGIAPVAEVASPIRAILTQQAKAKVIAAKMTGASLDEVATATGAEVGSITDLQQSAFYIDGVGVEQQLIGAICGPVPAGKLSKPVEGNSGVFLFDVTSVTPADNATAEGEKVRLETMAQSYIGERTNQALQEESKITDTRVKYF